ncbi:MAG TPA: LytTR family DNA-binding domain-containing protein [Saprospiraceae bacterium]|nr:LytTR family DNA-binding domain-containing protein [Saprospiraceae bacterium]
MKKISALIVDDEISAINTLSGMLQEFCPYIQVVGTASNEAAALSGINQYKPEIVFLDIEMPPFSNGIDMISRLPERSFQTIVTTAYPQYAVQSVNAIQPAGYLIKPYSVDQLVAVLKSTLNAISGPKPEKKTTEKTGFIISDRKRGHVVIKYADVLYCKAEDACVSIVYLENNKEQKIVTYKSLKEIEDDFPDQFLRIHHNTIVNMDKISRYINIGRAGKLYLCTHSTLDISVSKMPQFQARFDAFIKGE